MIYHLVLMRVRGGRERNFNATQANRRLGAYTVVSFPFTLAVYVNTPLRPSARFISVIFLLTRRLVLIAAPAPNPNINFGTNFAAPSARESVRTRTTFRPRVDWTGRMYGSSDGARRELLVRVGRVAGSEDWVVVSVLASAAGGAGAVDGGEFSVWFTGGRGTDIPGPRGPPPLELYSRGSPSSGSPTPTVASPGPTGLYAVSGPEVGQKFSSGIVALGAE